VHQVFSITQGTVRGVGNEDFPVSGHDEVLRIKARMLTATNPTNPGDSGGPLVNKHGEQVAVTESGMSGVQQVNSFVDVMEVRSFLTEKKILLTDDDPPAVATTPKVGPGSAKTQPKEFTPKDPPKGTVPGPGPDKKVDPTPATDPTGPSAAEEKAAEQLLQRAKLFEEGDDNRATYISKLKDVVAKYPSTAAGKEAKKKLDALK
jgi:hypothetical protein